LSGSTGVATCVNQAAALFLQVVTVHCRIPPVPSGPIATAPAPAAVAGEKDGLVGVGFLAQLDGVSSHGLLLQALRRSAAWKHRGRAVWRDSDSRWRRHSLRAFPWSFVGSGLAGIAARNGCPTAGLAMCSCRGPNPGAWAAAGPPIVVKQAAQKALACGSLELAPGAG